ncbi:MAG: hypothetical protein LBF27_13465 [Sphingobacterium sp.]|jgi:hypothetical protein|nr:hypothetical protein [Sphingobacterium sp.]
MEAKHGLLSGTIFYEVERCVKEYFCERIRNDFGAIDQHIDALFSGVLLLDHLK